MSPETARAFEEHRLPSCPEPGSSVPTIVAAWSALVDLDPDAVAIVVESEVGSTTVSRTQLDEHARRVAGVLRTTAGPAPSNDERVVAVLAPHGAATVVAILAVLRAGFGYLVLDPRWPRARIDACCRTARPVAVLVTAATSDSARTSGVAVIDLASADSSADSPTGSADAPEPSPPSGPDALAYLLFTSGSTGTPKAVRQSHRGVLTCADNQRSALGLGPGDVLTLLTPFCYDMAAVDLWSALLSGAAVAPYDLATRGLTGIEQFLTRGRVTVFHCAPTVLRTLGQLGGRIDGAVHTVLLGGEATVRRDVVVARALFGPEVRIACGYGSTEASFSTLFLLTGTAGDTPADGRPSVEDGRVPGDARGPGAPLPMGPSLPGFSVELDESGEILVTGRGVALGYLGDDTASVADRFSSAPGGRRTFRTGDLGERIGGQLYHRGRLDRQIKVRGVRIDPAEVEAILSDVPGVTGVLVGPAESPGGDHQALIAQLTVRAGVELAAADLHRMLSGVLPAAMVPSRFEVVERLDVTDTGKRVRRQSSGAPAPDRAGDAEDPLVDRVRRAVADVLAVDPSSIDPGAPLLESGAHSLDLVRIHAALSTWAEIQLLDLFGLGTVSAIAGHLDRTRPVPVSSAAAGRGAPRPDTGTRAGRRATRVPPRSGR